MKTIKAYIDFNIGKECEIDVEDNLSYDEIIKQVKASSFFKQCIERIKGFDINDIAVVTDD